MKKDGEYMKILNILKNIAKKLKKQEDKEEKKIKRMLAEEWIALATEADKTTVAIEDAAIPHWLAQILQKEPEDRKNTNNWRKMHGMPMKRKGRGKGRYERGKGTDTH